MSKKYTYKNKLPDKLLQKQKNNLFAHKVGQDQKSKKTVKKSIQRISTTSWKVPTIFLCSLMMIILIIPTLIVVPFVNSEPMGTSSVDNGLDRTRQSTSSQLTVAVTRMETDRLEEVPLENYVMGVVASEMPIEFEMEALKAQALAARTYVVNYLLHQSVDENGSITDTTSHQVYRNEDDLRKIWGKDYQQNMEKLITAVEATEGKIITYDNEPITPAFFSTSNGYTENSEDYWENPLPYLRSVESPWDIESPKFYDQKIFSIQHIEDVLEIDLSKEQTVSIETSRTEGQRVSEVRIGEQHFSGREVREKLDLKSSDFTIELYDDHFIFKTKGYGHGIGMSQYGANGMAKEGKTYEDIIHYYFQDVEISSLVETAPALVSR